MLLNALSAVTSLMPPGVVAVLATLVSVFIIFTAVNIGLTIIWVINEVKSLFRIW